MLCLALLGFALPGLAWLCFALLDFAWLCLALLCMAWLGFALLCLAWLGLALLCFAWLGLAWYANSEEKVEQANKPSKPCIHWLMGSWVPGFMGFSTPGRRFFNTVQEATPSNSFFNTAQEDDASCNRLAAGSLRTCRWVDKELLLGG